MYTKLKTFGLKKYLTSKTSEVQKAQDQAPSPSGSPTTLFCTLTKESAEGGRAVK